MLCCKFNVLKQDITSIIWKCAGKCCKELICSCMLCFVICQIFKKYTSSLNFHWTYTNKEHSYKLFFVTFKMFRGYTIYSSDCIHVISNKDSYLYYREGASTTLMTEDRHDRWMDVRVAFVMAAFVSPPALQCFYKFQLLQGKAKCCFRTQLTVSRAILTGKTRICQLQL